MPIARGGVKVMSPRSRYRREEQEERDDRQAGENRQDAADGREQEDVVGDVALEDRINAAERRPVECQQGSLPGGRATAPEEEAEKERQRKRHAPKERRQVDRRHVRPELHGKGERMQSPAHDTQIAVDDGRGEATHHEEERQAREDLLGEDHLVANFLEPPPVGQRGAERRPCDGHQREEQDQQDERAAGGHGILLNRREHGR
ncbi:MAG: hypothetical protein V9E87_07435 [Gemmatimonadales bacterium]